MRTRYVLFVALVLVSVGVLRSALKEEEVFDAESESRLVDAFVVPLSDPDSVRRLVERPGVLPGSYERASRSKISSPLDLPRIFPNVELGENPRKFVKTFNYSQTVCLFNRTPRQRSIFVTNVLSLWGSDIMKYNFVSVDSSYCQHKGTCSSLNKFVEHPDCPKGSKTARLVERIKCCQHERFEKILETASKAYDLVIASGDEFCRANIGSRAHFRMYYGDNKFGSTPTYIPLGPREEFDRVKPKHVLLAHRRQYAFNFLGSLTSQSRRELSRVLETQKFPKPKFVHIIKEWTKEATPKNGYVSPTEYRKILLDSTFTLCPEGHNPEAFRIYEALEAGSVPIVVLDASYQRHECSNAFKPLLDARAPFVVLNSWKELGRFVRRNFSDEELVSMQANAMEWYANYGKSIAKKVFAVLDAARA